MAAGDAQIEDVGSEFIASGEVWREEETKRRAGDDRARCWTVDVPFSDGAIAYAGVINDQRIRMRNGDQDVVGNQERHRTCRDAQRKG